MSRVLAIGAIIALAVWLLTNPVREFIAGYRGTAGWYERKHEEG